VAQPTDTPERFEISEPSTALPVPALSRYARPEAAAVPIPEPASGPAPANAASAATATETNFDPSPDTTPEAATAAEPVAPPSQPERPVDPIVQAASEEWATDPSPPQPVEDARDGGTAPNLAPNPASGTHAPALREAPHPDEPKRRRPFWKRIAMARPAAEPQAQPQVAIPPDLLKPALERIDHLTRRFEREQKALHERLDEFEHNLTRLWELEEQMGMEEVRAQLAVMRANQEETADAVHALAKRVTIGASAVVASFASLLLWLIL